MTAFHRPIAVPLRRLQTRAAQRGAALITSMVILLILTIIGITALGTTSLEQKMAVNIQEANRAFEAAESGLTRMFNAAGSYNLYSALNDTFTFGSGGEGGKAVVQAQFLGWSDPPRGSGYSAVRFSSAHFDSNSQGNAGSGASVTLHQGAYQITPK